MIDPPDNRIVREGRDPERELDSRQKRFVMITHRSERFAWAQDFFKSLRVDALAACAMFLVAFAVMVFSPPLDTVKQVLVTAGEHWASAPKSLPVAVSSGSSWREEETRPEPAVESEAGEVHYRDCNAAYAAGAAPIRIGEPGYESRMDGDGDGIACEPLR
jgi:hypothetical protein